MKDQTDTDFEVAWRAFTDTLWATREGRWLRTSLEALVCWLSRFCTYTNTTDKE